jgi:hypothetical protein
MVLVFIVTGMEEFACIKTRRGFRVRPSRAHGGKRNFLSGFNADRHCFSICFMKVPVQVEQSPSDRFIVVKPFLKPVIGFPKSVI